MTRTDRARAIEEAARLLLPFLPSGPNGAMPDGPLLRAGMALRAALAAPSDTECPPHRWCNHPGHRHCVKCDIRRDR